MRCRLRGPDARRSPFARTCWSFSGMEPERILRRDLLKRVPPLAAAALPARAAEAFQVGAYYFPGYHPDPRTAAAHGPGWTEWELVKRAEPRFPGHRQPKVPLWGRHDESRPAVAAQQIAAAADHGITGFIYDWYWDEDGPFLNRALEQGFLQAGN